MAEIAIRQPRARSTPGAPRPRPSARRAGRTARRPELDRARLAPDMRAPQARQRPRSSRRRRRECCRRPRRASNRPRNGKAATRSIPSGGSDPRRHRRTIRSARPTTPAPTSTAAHPAPVISSSRIGSARARLRDHLHGLPPAPLVLGRCLAYPSEGSRMRGARRHLPHGPAQLAGGKTACRSDARMIG